MTRPLLADFSPTQERTDTALHKPPRITEKMPRFFRDFVA